MSSWVPAEIAERLSDIAAQEEEFDYFLLEHIETALDSCKDLSVPIAMVLQCKGSTLQQFEEARQQLENAMRRRFEQ